MQESCGNAASVSCVSTQSTRLYFSAEFFNSDTSEIAFLSSIGEIPVPLNSASRLIIFRSGSMGRNIPTPLPATPVTPSILRSHSNRLGAVYLSLHGFWQSRRTALIASGSRAQGQTASARKDAYSVILFNHAVSRSFENDFQSTPDNMLQSLLQYQANGGTDYELAITETEAVMRRHWNSERCVITDAQSGMLT